MAESCLSCRFWLWNVEGNVSVSLPNPTSFCRRYPPLDPERGPLPTHASFWCGEYRGPPVNVTQWGGQVDRQSGARDPVDRHEMGS